MFTIILSGCTKITVGSNSNETTSSSNNTKTLSWPQYNELYGKDLKVDTSFNITSQDEEYIYADILIKNPTVYKFSPGVQVGLVQDVNHDNESYYIYARLKEELNSNEWKFQVKIPKILFTALKNIDSNRVMLLTSGYFYDEENLKVISGLSQSEEIYLNK